MNGINFGKVWRDSLRMYFAPLTGAYRAVCSEMRRMDRENTRRVGNRNRVDSTKHA